MNKLILSLFPGIDLFGRGFEENGFTVVQGQDKILGGDIRRLRGIPGRFDGIIGGSPCQEFSKLHRTIKTGEGIALLKEFERVVTECDPEFFVYENVATVPNLTIPGFVVFRFSLSPNDLGYSQSRNRHFQIGSKRGYVLNITKSKFKGTVEPIALASEGGKTLKRTYSDFCRLQGIEPLKLPELTKEGRYRVVGNAVHLEVSKAIARAFKEQLLSPAPQTVYNTRVCACGCGMKVTGKQKSYSPACRKRIQFSGVTDPRPMVPADSQLN